MKENKEKELISGNEIVQTKDVFPFQTRPTISKTLKLVPPVSLKKKKAVYKTIDTGNLPSR